MEEFDAHYEQHTDFLSNPLLLTIMLLTFDQVAEIPRKMHIFYGQAFETLFHRHDATKAVYKRETATNLPIDQFTRILAAFSFLAYAHRRFEFSESQALTLIGKAVEVAGVEIDGRERRDFQADYLTDLCDAVCILQQEGLNLVFTHKSFQDYFAAVFLANVSVNDRPTLLRTAVQDRYQDNMLALLFEMNPELVEGELLVPWCEQVLKEARESLKRKNGWLKVLRGWYDGLHVDVEAGRGHFLHGNQSGRCATPVGPSRLLRSGERTRRVVRQAVGGVVGRERGRVPRRA